jgi:uncharacterized Zn-binding protein involved in type VI secretion
MPPAARILDPLSCAMHVTPPSPVNGAVSPRTDMPTVNIGFLPAVRMGDKVKCVTGSDGTIVKGEPTVFIEGQPAARMGDPIGHQGIPSGVIALGCVTVNIGMLPQVAALRMAAQQGTAFCEECERSAGEPGKGKGP